MFTGIVREIGTVVALDGDEDGARLVVQAPATAAEGPRIGDSVALDGCCLTVTGIDGDRLAFTAVPETLELTSLGSLDAGSTLNVEPALRLGEPLGGHIVQGHVDGRGTIEQIDAEGEGKRLTLSAPDDVLRYCVYKGSIAIDGVSLTIAAVRDETFEIALIPHTLAATTLGARSAGDRVNLEVDVLAKHVERLTEGYRSGASG
ncbi:MAG: riboflavin synthase [Gaiellaceae bacterium]